MGDRSKIEWTESSWNPIRARNLATGRLGWHCTHASEGCRNCYAESMNRWRGTMLAYKPGHEGDVEIFADDEILTQPLRWTRPRMIFVCSMTDLFADFVTDEMIDRVFAVMALCPQHTFQVLTKRPERMRDYFAGHREDGEFHEGIRDALVEGMAQSIYADRTGEDPSMWLSVQLPLPNVWLGTSVEDQATADARIPELLATPAAVRWISAEPLLGPVDLEVAWHGENALDSECWGDCGWCEKGYPPLHNCRRSGGDPWGTGRSGLDWVVVGFESGPKARARDVSLVREIVGQCKAAAVPVFVKQLGPKVIDRNDAGFDGCEPSGWDVNEDLIEHNIHGYLDEAQGADCLIRLRDRKGGDWSEWPHDLRVREYPEVPMGPDLRRDDGGK